MDHPRIAPTAVMELIPFATARLHDAHPRSPVTRSKWQRFVAIRIDAQQSAAMSPALTIGAVAVIDRHSLSLTPTRPAEVPIFAVRSGSSLLARFVEFDDDRLILRPASFAASVQLIPLAPGQPPSSLLVGRISLVLNTI